jgi:hypothetical protein
MKFSRKGFSQSMRMYVDRWPQRRYRLHGSFQLTPDKLDSEYRSKAVAALRRVPCHELISALRSG